MPSLLNGVSCKQALFPLVRSTGLVPPALRGRRRACTNGDFFEVKVLSDGSMSAAHERSLRPAGNDERGRGRRGRIAPVWLDRAKWGRLEPHRPWSISAWPPARREERESRRKPRSFMVPLPIAAVLTASPPSGSSRSRRFASNAPPRFSTSNQRNQVSRVSPHVEQTCAP